MSNKEKINKLIKSISKIRTELKQTGHPPVSWTDMKLKKLEKLELQLINEELGL